MITTEAPSTNADKQTATRRQVGSAVGEVAASVKNEEEGEEEDDEREKDARKQQHETDKHEAEGKSSSHN